MENHIMRLYGEKIAPQIAPRDHAQKMSANPGRPPTQVTLLLTLRRHQREQAWLRIERRQNPEYTVHNSDAAPGFRWRSPGLRKLLVAVPWQA
jgi:hypothetical protein